MYNPRTLSEHLHVVSDLIFLSPEKGSMMISELEEQEVKQTTPAISAFSYNLWGCPNCGYLNAPIDLVFNSDPGFSIGSCGECKQGLCILYGGIHQATTTINHRYPTLIKHPRIGTPFHLKADIPPETGEHFYVRGIGLDRTPGCFVCGGQEGLHNNVAAFVQTKASGERVLALFSQGATLDFREREPNRIQVKIGACDEHKEHLEALSRLTYNADGTITKSMVDEVLKLART